MNKKETKERLIQYRAATQLSKKSKAEWELMEKIGDDAFRDFARNQCTYCHSVLMCWFWQWDSFQVEKLYKVTKMWMEISESPTQKRKERMINLLQNNLAK